MANSQFSDVMAAHLIRRQRHRHHSNVRSRSSITIRRTNRRATDEFFVNHDVRETDTISLDLPFRRSAVNPGAAGRSTVGRARAAAAVNRPMLRSAAMAERTPPMIGPQMFRASAGGDWSFGDDELTRPMMFGWQTNVPIGDGSEEPWAD